jgi:glycosyltransferase involved in cell wall biosynthesis
VILEAMQAGVPVMYAEDAGAGEFLQSGIRINPEKIEEVANQIVELLLDTYRWQQIVDEQLKEIGNYPKRGYEEGLIVLWDRLSQPIPAPTS